MMMMTLSDPQAVLLDAEERMNKAIASTQHELGTLRTGRANPSMLDRVSVDYYGTPTPVRQMANCSISEGTTVIIQPYDKSTLSAIERAIAKSDLGLTPNNDGSIIRLSIPALSTDRRKEICKLAAKLGEEGKVAIRNVRRDAMDDLNKLKKEANLPEDELKSLQDVIQKKTDAHIKELDKVVKEKEEEILQV
jgi:ribosome recycling factor